MPAAPPYILRIPRHPGQENRTGLLELLVELVNDAGDVAHVHSWGETRQLAVQRATLRLREDLDDPSYTPTRAKLKRRT